MRAWRKASFAFAMACVLAVVCGFALGGCASGGSGSGSANPLATTVQSKSEGANASSASSSGTPASASASSAAANASSASGAQAAPSASSDNGSASAAAEHHAESDAPQEAESEADHGTAPDDEQADEREDDADYDSTDEDPWYTDQEEPSPEDNASQDPPKPEPDAGGNANDTPRNDAVVDPQPVEDGDDQNEAPVEDEPENNALTVEVTIDSANAAAANSKYPDSLGTYIVEIEEGATVYDVLVATGVDFTTKGSNYIDSIGGIAEKACSPTSGWMYSVDGVFPSRSAMDYVLQGGETIRWAYTVSMGDLE